MRVAILGSGGQLGTELRKTAPPGIEVIALDYPDIDLERSGELSVRLKELKPTAIINAAAYTAVDAAEQDEAKAFTINAEAPQRLAELATKLSARLLHVSTDFVFDGTKARPYEPSDAPNPLSAYGRTKLAGERAVIETAGHRALVLRTSWLYSAHAKNFALTMLRLFRERGSVQVVADQVGCPTWAKGLARVLWALAEKPELSGVWHFSDAGVASWYDFAHAIGQEATQLGLLSTSPVVSPISTQQYPTPARRPAFSVLDSSATRVALALVATHWREQLSLMLRELPRP